MENNNNNNINPEMETSLLRNYLSLYPQLTKELILKAIRTFNCDKEKINVVLKRKNHQLLLKILKSKYNDKLTESEMLEVISTYSASGKIINECERRIKEKNFKMEGNEIENSMVIKKLDLNESPVIEEKRDHVERIEPKEKEEEVKSFKNIEEMVEEMKNTHYPQILTLKVFDNEKYVLKINYPEKTTSSWVGLYRKGSADKNYLCSNYLSNLKDDIYICDRPYLNGEYQFRLFHQSNYISQNEKKAEILDTVNNQDFFLFKSKEDDPKQVVISWKIASFDVLSCSPYYTVHKEEEERIGHYRRSGPIKTQIGSSVKKKPQHTGVYNARIYIENELKMVSKETVSVIQN